MLEKIFSRLGGKPDAPDTPENTASDLQRAVAALFVEAARADENYDEREKALIDKSLAAKFSLSPEEAAALREEGEKAQSAATDIQRFTRRAKELSKEEKVALIEGLWEVILSDGERDSFEDTLMRRICGLIYVDDRVSGEARQRVEAKLSGQ